MRRILFFSFLLLISLLLVACGGQDSLIPITIDGATEMVDEELENILEDNVPRFEVTPTPPLPPTFTPQAMAHQGHLYLLPVSGADGSIQYAYKVNKGDSLTAICDMFNVSVEDVMIINEISDANHIEVGDLLIIPVEDY